MKHQTTNRRALAIRKVTAARKRQRGFALEWIVIVFLVIAALVPAMLLISKWMTGTTTGIINILLGKSPKDTAAATQNVSKNNQGIKTEIPDVEQTGGNVNNYGGNGGGNGGE